MTNQLEDAPTKTEQEEAPNQDMNLSITLLKFRK